MSLIAVLWLLVWVLVAVALVWVALWVIDLLASQLGMPARLAQVLKAIVVVIAIIVVATWLIGFLPPPPALRPG